MATRINLNGINELDLTLDGTTTATVSGGVVSVVNTGGGGGGYSLGGAISNANVTLGPGAGTGAVVLTAIGFDGSHAIGITTGTSPVANDILWTLTFTDDRGHTVYPVLSIGAGGTTPYTSADQIVGFDGSSTSAFYTIAAGTTALQAGNDYVWTVSCP